jgi:cytochrome c biogenesis protein CcdA/thiol-disulfide isomerase/thioredoxin
MILLFLAYLGGVLTILSPCILPVLPFVFARSDQPFRKSGLPLLVGMAATFALVASLVTLGGAWAVRANQFGRIAALILFAIFGLTLLIPSLAERLSRPLVQLGSRLSQNPEAGPGILNSFVLGIATGLLWTPCAGPILGLILTGAALSGASAHTAILLLVYAAGAATSLAVALLAGGRVFKAMKSSLGAEEWIRHILGVAVLAGVAAVAFGLDRGLLTQLSQSGTTNLEQRLVARAVPIKQEQTIVINDNPSITTPVNGDSDGVPSALANLSGATAWINLPNTLNTTSLTAESLRGKVVLIDFWTYSCINCLRTLPYLNTWHGKYKDSGLVVIGVHTPEFPFEKDEANVRNAVRELGIAYPVAMDNNYRIWRAFHNQYWPAHYFIDAEGRVRHHHFGEGNYDESETWIRRLLAERNHQPPPVTATKIAASGAEAASNFEAVQSPETYIGYDRAENFASPGGFNKDAQQQYQEPEKLKLNEWALTGEWKDETQIATLLSSSGSIVYRFHARDLHLVLGPPHDGKPARFRVTLDGKPPGADHGEDCDADGNGTVTENRLYQLIRQKSSVRDRVFRIEFLSPGAQAFAFTFG